MYWVEFSLGVVSMLSASVLLSLIVADRGGAVRKRIINIVRANLPARRRMNKLSIDMAMHTLADVDMEWWDLQFEKLSPEPKQLRLSQISREIRASRQGRDWRTEVERDADYRRALDALQERMARAQAMDEIRKAQWLRDQECPDCEYGEISTYANSYVKLIKTWDCDKCRSPSRISPLWPPIPKTDPGAFTKVLG